MADMKIVYVITENEKTKKKFWNRIGSAFVNRDGSINVRLDAFPVGGEMQIRDYVPRDDERPGRAPAQAPAQDQGGDDDDSIPF